MIAPKAVAQEPNIGPDRKRISKPPIAGLGHAMEDWTAMGQTEKKRSAILTDVRIANGVNGVRGVLVQPNAKAQNITE